MKRLYVIACLIFFCSMRATKDTAKPQELPNNSLAGLRKLVTRQYNLEKKNAPDAQRKNAECVELVDTGIKHIEAIGMDRACKDFIYDASWRKGEIVNFIVDDQGFILCYGNYEHLIWKNINQFTSYAGVPILKTMQAVPEDGAWINYTVITPSQSKGLSGL